MLRTLTSAAELQACLRGNPATTLIQVLPDDVFAARRIPGSRHACVFEVAFVSRVETFCPDKTMPLVVYGAGGGSADARVAGEKLAAAGYTDLGVFEGGLAAWETAGGALEGGGRLTAEPVLDGVFRVDVSTSIVRWTGRNLFNHHSGTLKPGSGELHFSENRLAGGRVVLDLNSIACEDIADPETNAMLIRHLRDADFFLVDRYPTAEVVIRRADPIPGGSVGRPNWRVCADITLRGVTRPAECSVLVAAAAPERLTVQAQLDLDRTEFGSLYGSGRFFRFLGQHVVNDHVHLHLKLHAAIHV